jgi:hypothetical protein
MAIYLIPHSDEWFSALEKFNPDQAAHSRLIIERARRLDICTVCGDDPASDYKLVHPEPVRDAVATIRLCRDCRMLRENDGEIYVALS